MSLVDDLDNIRRCLAQARDVNERRQIHLGAPLAELIVKSLGHAVAEARALEVRAGALRQGTAKATADFPNVVRIDAFRTSSFNRKRKKQ